MFVSHPQKRKNCKLINPHFNSKIQKEAKHMVFPQIYWQLKEDKITNND